MLGVPWPRKSNAPLPSGVTTSAPPVFTNWQHVSVAPYTSPRLFADGCHRLPPLRHNRGSMLYGFDNRSVGSQRHRLGDTPNVVKVSLICISDGFALLSRSSVALIIMPFSQNPHCGVCSSIHACCTGCSAYFASSAERPFCLAHRAGSPSSVVISWFGATSERVVMQERTSLPSISTEQAPHCASPQPNCGPTNSSSLRNT